MQYCLHLNSECVRFVIVAIKVRHSSGYTYTVVRAMNAINGKCRFSGFKEMNE